MMWRPRMLVPSNNTLVAVRTRQLVRRFPEQVTSRTKEQSVTFSHTHAALDPGCRREYVDDGRRDSGITDQAPDRWLHVPQAQLVTRACLVILNERLLRVSLDFEHFKQARAPLLNCVMSLNPLHPFRSRSRGRRREDGSGYQKTDEPARRTQLRE
jgi:hypothetical protein